MTKGDADKHWACSDCFVSFRIEGRAEIVHHWGYERKKDKPDEEPLEE